MEKYSSHPMCTHCGQDYINERTENFCNKCITRNFDILSDDQLNYFLTFGICRNLSFSLFKRILKRIDPNLGYRSNTLKDRSYLLTNLVYDLDHYNYFKHLIKSIQNIYFIFGLYRVIQKNKKVLSYLLKTILLLEI